MFSKYLTGSLKTAKNQYMECVSGSGWRQISESFEITSKLAIPADVLMSPWLETHFRCFLSISATWCSAFRTAGTWLIAFSRP